MIMKSAIIVNAASILSLVFILVFMIIPLRECPELRSENVQINGALGWLVFELFNPLDNESAEFSF